MRRFAQTALLLVCLLLLLTPAVASAAGTTTGIVRAHSNLDVYTWTPTETGYLEITLGWTELDGDPTGGYPEAEVYVIVQGSDGLEPYAEMELTGLLSGWNPTSASLFVRSYQVGWPMFFSVSPSITDVRYRLTVDFRKTIVSPYTRVVDATGTAHPTHGDLFLPATATVWHSVLHDWRGSTGDLYANWDDYVDTRSSGWLVSNGSVQWKPPVVSNASTAGRAGQWVTLMPTLWNGAARPNVWFDPTYDTWPMPGSLLVHTAPAWYTWAYSDSAAATSRPAYAFGSLFTSHASGWSYSFAREPGAMISYAFTGDTLSWLYRAGPDGGTATLSIEPPEGSEAPTQMWTVDQYSPVVEFGRRFDLSGLGVGAHTVVVESDATLCHDAFIAPSDAADPVPLAEDHGDGSTRYAWAKAAYGGASGSSCSYSAARDSATAFTFSGSALTWRYVRRPDGGIARVWIDGVGKATVDQYGRRHKRHGGPLAGSVTYSGLPAGTHTILIVNSGTANAQSTGTVVTSDAFVVGGVTFED